MLLAISILDSQTRVVVVALLVTQICGSKPEIGKKNIFLPIVLKLCKNQNLGRDARLGPCLKNCSYISLTAVTKMKLAKLEVMPHF